MGRHVGGSSNRSVPRDAGDERPARRLGQALRGKVVALLCLGFGLVSLDRSMSAAMFPTLARELRLSDQDLGLVSGVLSLGASPASPSGACPTASGSAAP